VREPVSRRRGKKGSQANNSSVAVGAVDTYLDCLESVGGNECVRSLFLSGLTLAGGGGGWCKTSEEPPNQRDRSASRAVLHQALTIITNASVKWATSTV
jgi:hypothetical protein